MAQVLRYFAADIAASPNLLVGLAAPDDAAVYRLNDEQAVVATVDFFAPLVDDPYSYGAIAAANALSDVYAMGAEAVLALNVAAFPEDLPGEMIAAILRGGAEKVAAAGAVIAGGHTIIDAEPKYGLCVLGLVHPQQVLTKAGALPGDLLYLTKPLGTGIITTAAMHDKANPEHLQAAVDAMTTLNRHASHLARQAQARALTDVTGYSLLGHAFEMAAAGGVCLRISAGAVPLLPGALDYAAAGILTGGAARNRQYLAGKVHVAKGVAEPLEHVLFDPQTSGGLLIAVPPAQAPVLETAGAARIGEVTVGSGVDVTP